jgi:predicted O-methyltransferase YrrM
MDSRDFNTFTDFMDKIIADKPGQNHRFDCFAPITLEGMVLEFGVAGGHSIRELASVFPDRHIHGFDSFEGLPEAWRPEFPEGIFKCDVPHVPDNVTLHQGLFNETLPSFLEANPGPIAFLHLDADLYSSTAYVLELVEDRLIDGSIVIFDELHYWYDNYKEHEYKAFDEFIQRTGFQAQFLHRRRPEAYCFKLIR